MVETARDARAAVLRTSEVEKRAANTAPSQERLPGPQRQKAKNRPLRLVRLAETAPRRSQPRKSPQVRGLCTWARDFVDRVDCVVETRGLKLRARHAVLSNRSL